MNLKWGLLLAVFVSTAGIHSSVRQPSSSKSYTLTGVVEKHSENSIILSRNGERFEFQINSFTNAVTPEEFVPGDVVTIWYTLNANKIRLERNSTVPFPKERNFENQPILDDRAFYAA